ncbi:MAG: hypothetical protein ABII23_00515 [bacterium]
MKKYSAVACVIILCTLAGSLFADFGKSGWIIFRKTQSPRFKALTAAMPITGDLSGMLYNPAITATAPSKEIFFLSELGFTDDVLGGLLYSHPLSKGALAGGLIHYDAGEMELNWIDGTQLKNKTVTAQQDTLAVVSYGRQVFLDNLYTGINLKCASSNIAETKDVTASALDWGLLYAPLSRLFVSLSANNFGSASAFVDKKESLPSSIYGGAGYAMAFKGFDLTLGAGTNYLINESETVSLVGFEVGYGAVSFNTGYIINREEANMHFGIGITYRRFDFSYAFIPGVYFDPTQRISLGCKF